MGGVLPINSRRTTDQEKSIGSPMTVEDFAELPLKRKQKYLKKLYSHIDEQTSSD
tara:strand:- start:395 stop:559 length:165 start_codon:yes stop_codon:yes gene_type:complete